MRIATIEPPPKKEDKPKEQRTLETKVELDVTAEADWVRALSLIESAGLDGLSDRQRADILLSALDQLKSATPVPAAASGQAE